MTVETKKGSGGLGRGLAALIPTGPPSVSDANEAAPGSINIDVDAIRPNPQQPRRSFDPDALRELSASIREHGVITPVLVVKDEDGFVLIAGERRLRAARQAGLQRIPAVIRTASDQERLSLALVENIQRSDLNAIDEALGYRRLMDEFGLTQEQVAQRVGRSRPSIANGLRLLDVAPEVQQAVVNGSISGGHARALASLDGHAAQATYLSTVVARALSVRQTEGLVAAARDGSSAPRRSRAAKVDPDMQHMEARMRESLGTKVTISPSTKGGRIAITWYDDDDLGRLVDELTNTDR
jgi:ParB family chromosome partitioning protein